MSLNFTKQIVVFHGILTQSCSFAGCEWDSLEIIVSIARQV